MLPETPLRSGAKARGLQEEVLGFGVREGSTWVGGFSKMVFCRAISIITPIGVPVEGT